MKQKFSKVICCITVVMLLCSMTTQFASASDSSYVLSGGKFSHMVQLDYDIICLPGIPYILKQNN